MRFKDISHQKWPDFLGQRVVRIHLRVEREVDDVDRTRAAEDGRRNPHHCAVVLNYCQRIAMLFQPRVGAIPTHTERSTYWRGGLA